MKKKQKKKARQIELYYYLLSTIQNQDHKLLQPPRLMLADEHLRTSIAHITCFR
jgi:hypothetical protein